ncbi:hypothetical protein [Erythrobacter oryzae]|uniref:hypothetical protein n=1 Tax=Erythrobacter oryzae TaxID=3019556 RepID=UPI0025576796|nr:hypothetical protein [Erythrobacter sp. COR-2]
MPYRPSTAWFELNAGSALVGVLPASVQAAAVGSVATLAVFLSPAFPGALVSFADLTIWTIPWLIAFLLLTILVATPVCALTAALVGVPLASLLGRRLAGPLGLAAAVGIPLAMGLAVAGSLGAASVWGEDVWIFPVLTTAYALPGGLFYRRAVLTSRALSPWDEPEPEPTA